MFYYLMTSNDLVVGHLQTCRSLNSIHAQQSGSWEFSIKFLFSLSLSLSLFPWLPTTSSYYRGTLNNVKVSDIV